MPISTYLRNGIANGVMNNQALVVPVFCGTLHDGDPGFATGSNAATTLVNTVEDRAQITSAAAVNGVVSSTGEPATWTIEEATTLTHLGTYDAFSAGNWLGSEPLDQPVTVADGDTVTLSAFTFTES